MVNFCSFGHYSTTLKCKAIIPVSYTHLQGNAHQSENVDKQVYALWNVLQKRNFKYSSTTNTSLSSNVVYTCLLYTSRCV